MNDLIVLNEDKVTKAYQNSSVLGIHGYEVYFTRFADSIIKDKDYFGGALEEITKVLEAFQITEDQIVSAGGGWHPITQNLAQLLAQKGWLQKNIRIKYEVDEKPLIDETHEIDHYKSFNGKSIGLEIEWNSKDTSFDRDLENFRKLHQIGELNIGIIITRGESLQKELQSIYVRQLQNMPFLEAQLIKEKFNISDNAANAIEERLRLPKSDTINRIATGLHSSKYAQTTTHLNKLLKKINQRGLGNPCPIIIIGIGEGRIKH